MSGVLPNISMWLCGVRYDSNEKQAIVYIVLYKNEKGDLWPLLTRERQIIFFAEEKYAEQIISTFLDKRKVGGYTLEKIEELFCFETAISLIRGGSRDDNTHILNMLNTLDDMLIAIDEPLAGTHKDALYSFANHLTFSKDYNSFFTGHNQREDVLDSVYWCVGKVLANSKFICGRKKEWKKG